jgi:hypothetical protein
LDFLRQADQRLGLTVSVLVAPQQAVAASQPGFEHFHKSGSDAESDWRKAGLLAVGFASAQLVTGFAKLRRYQSLAHQQKASFRLATSFLSMV